MRSGLTYWVVVMVVGLALGCRTGSRHLTPAPLPDRGGEGGRPLVLPIPGGVSSGPPLPNVVRVQRSAVVVGPPAVELKRVVVTNDPPVLFSGQWVDTPVFRKGGTVRVQVPTVTNLVMYTVVEFSTNAGKSWSVVATMPGTNSVSYWRWKTNTPGIFRTYFVCL